jgi:hypothetical protein
MGGSMSRRVGAAIAAAAMVAALTGCAAGNPPARRDGTTSPGAAAPGGGGGGAGAGAGTTNTGTAGVGATRLPGITGAGMAGNAGAATGSPAGYAGGLRNRLVRAYGDVDQGAHISRYVAGLTVISGAGGGGGSAGGTAGAGGGGMAGGGTTAGTTGTTGAGGGGTAGGGTTAGTTGTTGRQVGVSTLVVGDLAFIGIDLSTLQTGTTGRPGLSAAGDPRGSAGPGLEGYLRQQVLAEFPHLAQVFVTTSPGLVSRIARVTSDDNQEVQARTMINEMFDIARTLAGPVAAATGAPESSPASPGGGGGLPSTGGGTTGRSGR